MKRDIFNNCWSLGYLIIIVGFLLLSIISTSIKPYIFAAFLILIGGLCLFNFYNCGRVHCKITGYGFLTIGFLVLLHAMRFVEISDALLNIAILVVIIGAFSFEFLYKKKFGRCYKK